LQWCDIAAPAAWRAAVLDYSTMLETLPVLAGNRCLVRHPLQALSVRPARVVISAFARSVNPT